MKLADLSSDVIENIKTWRYDRIVEKHEGPERWSSRLEYGDPDMQLLAGHPVLLPVGQEHHPNILVLRSIISADGKSLTLFLKDTTYCRDTDDEWFCAGYFAFCEKVPGAEFYIATVYHEWFIVENKGLP